jgi:hypothetical protein
MNQELSFFSEGQIKDGTLVDRVPYDESDARLCPICYVSMIWSSGQKKFCTQCGYVDSCCN